MDQQQATNYILERLKLGYTKIDIAADLSRKVGAPPDLVMRFVNQVSDLHFQQNPSLEEEETALHEDQDVIEPSNESVHEWDPKDQEISYGSYPDEETVLGDTPEESAINASVQLAQEQYPSEKVVVNLETLTRFVVQSLKSHQRYNDIVESVCQQTGMTWNKAQRFVARTQTEHHKELTKSSRTLMIPLSIGFIIAGIFLLIWSIVTMFDYYNAFTGQDYSTLPAEFIFVIGGAFVSSFGLMAGGAFGLYRTLSRH